MRRGNVAVKMVPPGASVQETSQRLRGAWLELNVLSKLNHPNVVSLIGVSVRFPTEQECNDLVQNSQFYLGMVMELCAISLADTMQQSPLELPEVLHVARGLLQVRNRMRRSSEVRQRICAE